MRRFLPESAATLAVTVLCALAMPAAAQVADPLTVVPERGVVAFVDITVIPMDGVMVDGRWLDRARLNALLDVVAAVAGG